MRPCKLWAKGRWFNGSNYQYKHVKQPRDSTKVLNYARCKISGCVDSRKWRAKENRMEGVTHKMFISFLLVPYSPGEIRSWGFTINKQFQSKTATSLILGFSAYFAICFMQHLAFHASIVLWQDPFVRLSISSPSSTLLPTDEVTPCQIAGSFSVPELRKLCDLPEMGRMPMRHLFFFCHYTWSSRVPFWSCRVSSLRWEWHWYRGTS